MVSTSDEYTAQRRGSNRVKLQRALRREPKVAADLTRLLTSVYVAAGKGRCGGVLNEQY